MNWSQYAIVYDLMADSNPAYQQLLKDFCSYMTGLSIPPDGIILDLGAGTGQFSLLAAQNYPNCKIIHVDQDTKMIARAKEKAHALGVTNIEFVCGDVCSPQLEKGTVQLLLSIHCLYACGSHSQALEQAHLILAPGGNAYFIDPGRYLDIRDWSGYLFKHLVRSRGLFSAVATFIRGLPVARANRAILRLQKEGVYWTHTTDQFGNALKEAGFKICQLDTCYRGYSDRAICKKTDS